MATPRVSAGVVALHGDAVAMVRTTYKDYWDVPGGYVEPGESPESACRREVREELGIDAGRLVFASVDWAPNKGEGDKMLFLFAAPDIGPAELAAAHFDDGEIAEARFIPLAEIGDYTIPRLSRRLRATAEAISAGSAVYLEHGVSAASRAS
ncbi:NUDIX hydrolase [Gandjariella thermophila]|uniref:NUDIX hydrolase n=2 Tax=Gandjariella thermophila TaxID=1931992 RepID=A0A4D4J3Y4_9PSEU|nr:NUDIX hydrolase [Gandjariella thermophila]